MAKVERYMNRFNRAPSTPYSVITPATPLADVESFLHENIFALGACLLLSERSARSPACSH
jgi:hypothetical protein